MLCSWNEVSGLRLLDKASRSRASAARRPSVASGACSSASRATSKERKVTPSGPRGPWHGMSRTGTLGRLFGHQAEDRTKTLLLHHLTAQGLGRQRLSLAAQASQAPATVLVA